VVSLRRADRLTEKARDRLERILRTHPADAPLRRSAWGLVGLVLLQIVAGLANVALLAPVWMQLVHLLLADLVWIALVLSSARALSSNAAP